MAQRAAHRRSSDEKRKARKWEIIALLYRYRYSREDVLNLLRFIDWMIRLPKALERELRHELIALEEETQMAYIMSIERFAREEGLEKGWQEGRQEGLRSERQLLLRQVQKRFGAAVMEQSRARLEVIEDLTALEELGEGILDCADGEGWLALLARR